MSTETLSAGFLKYRETEIADDLTLSGSARTEGYRDAWNSFVNQLIGWGTCPHELEDDGIEAPSVQVIQTACELAMAMRDESLVPPDHILTNGNGGIVFERKTGTTLKTIEIEPDGSIDLTIYKNGRLDSRGPFVTN